MNEKAKLGENLSLSYKNLITVGNNVEKHVKSMIAKWRCKCLLELRTDWKVKIRKTKKIATKVDILSELLRKVKKQLN